MVKVLSETSLGNLFLEVLVCSCKDSYIDCDVLVASYSAKLLFLKYAENLSLSCKRHIADLIKEECTSVCLLELSLMLLDRRCEGALLVAKQLALYKF